MLVGLSDIDTHLLEVHSGLLIETYLDSDDGVCGYCAIQTLLSSQKIYVSVLLR